jgi:uncharacterized ferritin-like protein (DUF455 family)
MTADSPAPAASVEAWALRFITTAELGEKLAPAPCPGKFAGELGGSAIAPLRVAAPGRPPELSVVGKAKRSLGRDKMQQPRWRAQVLHTFLHHELQAAELMCWAILAFPDTPLAFRRGLLKICGDELRHLQIYQRQVERLGHRVGDFAVRDWFWQRVASCATPVQFVALMGIGLEGGNLDHAARFAQWFADAGDPEAAHAQEVVGREEIGHVEFAARWFTHWTGGLDFARWASELPPPLSPTLLRGQPLNRDARARAGLPDAFLDALARS